MAATHNWYAIVAHSQAACTHPDPPKGPWRGRDAAEEAFGRWSDRLGPDADQAVTAMSVRVSGPYCTREEARNADITDGGRHMCQHWDFSTLGPIPEQGSRWTDARDEEWEFTVRSADTYVGDNGPVCYVHGLQSKWGCTSETRIKLSSFSRGSLRRKS